MRGTRKATTSAPDHSRRADLRIRVEPHKPPIGPFRGWGAGRRKKRIHLDFDGAEASLVVELDGMTHTGREA